MFRKCYVIIKYYVLVKYVYTIYVHYTIYIFIQCKYTTRSSGVYNFNSHINSPATLYVSKHHPPPHSRAGFLADLGYAGEFWNEIDRVQQIIR